MRERMLRHVGEGVVLRPPFYCEYGAISIGDRTFVNVDAIVLDVAPVTIGAACQIATRVQLLTATHPIDPGPRRVGWEYAEPITIADDVWLGGGGIVCPGVTIGQDTVVGAASEGSSSTPTVASRSRCGYCRAVYRRAIGLALVLAVASPGVASAGSLIARSQRTGEAEIEGVGCGVAASRVVALPAAATEVQVREPKVGDTTPESRLTEAAVDGASVRLTAVGDGPLICDPAEDPDPPDTRSWYGMYDYDIAFRERVSARYWSLAGKLKTRPRSVTIRFIATVRKIRWRRFGGRKAVGFGRMAVDEPPGFTCTRRTCPGHGERFKVVLWRPSRCADNREAVWYGRVGFFTTKRILRIPKGGLFSSYKPSCGLSDPKPV